MYQNKPKFSEDGMPPLPPQELNISPQPQSAKPEPPEPPKLTKPEAIEKLQELFKKHSLSSQEVGSVVMQDLNPKLQALIEITKRQFDLFKKLFILHEKKDLKEEELRIDTKKILKELKKQLQEQQIQQKDTGSMDIEFKQRIGALEQSLNKGIDNALGQINARMDGVRARVDTIGVRIEEIIPSEPETAEEEPEIMDDGTVDTEEDTVEEETDVETEDDGVPKETVDTDEIEEKEGDVKKEMDTVDTEDTKIDSEEKHKEQPKVTDQEFLVQEIKAGRFKSYRQYQDDEKRPISRGKTARIVKKFIEKGKVQREERETEDTTNTQFKYVWVS